MLGVSSYKGDLNQSLFNPDFFHLSGGGFLRKNFNSHWSFRLNVQAGTISADDALSDNAFQNMRNLHFRSRVLEAAGIFEFNFFPFQLAKSSSSNMTPYVLSGIAVMNFDPKAEVNSEWVKLQPLGTEGQGTNAYPDRKKYKRAQVTIPVGGGFKFKLSNRFGLGIEAAARRTFTDYLDDVSTTYADPAVLAAENGALSAFLSDRSLDRSEDHTGKNRGTYTDEDWYMFAGVYLSFTLSKKYGDVCKPFEGKLR